MKDWNMEVGRIQVPLGEQMLTTEVVGDFSLPDYQPEIKRLLRIGVSVLPPNRYAGNGNRSMDLGGTLDYYVLYTGNDNGLYCAPLSADYRLTADAESGMSADGWSITEPMVCTCDATVETPVGRVTAPRRLNIRCRVNARVRTYAETTVGDGGGKSDAVERLTDEAEVGRLLWGMGDAIPLQDDMILTPTDGGEWRVVCAEGSALITEATAGMGMVNCRGEATVKLTLCPSGAGEEDGAATAPTVTYRKIPFAESVELEGVTPDCECCARGVCASLSVMAEEGHLHMDVGVVPEVMAQASERVRYTKDMYSTRRKTTERYATYPTEQSMRALNGNFTLSDSLSLEEVGIDPSTRVVDVSAVAMPEALTYDPAKERCVLGGKCRAQLLLLMDGEYSSAEMELPFRYEFDARTGGTPRTMGMDGDSTTRDVPISYSGGVQVLHCRARMDGERVGLDAELVVCLRTARPATLTALADMTEGEEVTRGRGEYVICFPSPDDSVWSVAKRYHAPLAALGAANNLQPASADAPESLEGINYLIV